MLLARFPLAPLCRASSKDVGTKRKGLKSAGGLMGTIPHFGLSRLTPYPHSPHGVRTTRGVSVGKCWLPLASGNNQRNQNFL